MSTLKTYTAQDIFDFWKTKPVLEAGRAKEPLIYENAVVAPISMYQGVCYNSDGDLIEQSVILRNAPGGKLAPQFNARPSIGKVEVPYTEDPVYFVSYQNVSHWGHFLTETLARCHHLDGEPMNVVSATDLGPIKQIFPQHNYVVTTKPFRTKKLILPVPTMEDCSYVLPEHIETLRKVAKFYGTEPQSNKKVYLSRTKVHKFRGQARWTDGEPELEKYLKESGWTICHFEDLKVSQQIGILEGAELLAGCVGSAFHNLMLTSHNPGKIVYLVSPITNPNYAHHDAILGNNSHYLECQDVTNPQLVRKKIRDPKETSEYLNSL